MSEIKHFTEEQVQESLRGGIAIADRLQLEGEERITVALWAAQKLSEKTILQGAPGIVPVSGVIQ